MLPIDPKSPEGQSIDDILKRLALLTKVLKLIFANPTTIATPDGSLIYIPHGRAYCSQLVKDESIEQDRLCGLEAKYRIDIKGKNHHVSVCENHMHHAFDELEVGKITRIANGELLYDSAAQKS